MKIKAITSSDEMWNKVRNYAEIMLSNKYKDTNLLEELRKETEGMFQV